MSVIFGIGWVLAISRIALLLEGLVPVVSSHVSSIMVDLDWDVDHPVSVIGYVVDPPIAVIDWTDLTKHINPGSGNNGEQREGMVHVCTGHAQQTKPTSVPDDLLVPVFREHESVIVPEHDPVACCMAGEEVHILVETEVSKSFSFKNLRCCLTLCDVVSPDILEELPAFAVIIVVCDEDFYVAGIFGVGQEAVKAFD